MYGKIIIQFVNLFSSAMTIHILKSIFATLEKESIYPANLCRFLQLSADWFLPSEASLKRSHIRKLIRDLLSETSHNFNPSTSCNGNASTSVYPGNNLEQKHGELLSVSPDKDAMDAASSPDRGDGIKLLRSSIVPCDKEAGFLFPEFLESAPESNLPLPEHVHEHSTSSKPLFASCPTMVLLLVLISN